MWNPINDAVFGKCAGYDFIASTTDNPIIEHVLLIGSIGAAGYFTLRFLGQVGGFLL